MTAEAFWRTCIHEAGHAVAAVAHRRGIRYVSVNSRGETAGRCTMWTNPPMWREWTPAQLEAEIHMMLAGLVAEDVCFGTAGDFAERSYDGDRLAATSILLSKSAPDRVEDDGTLDFTPTIERYTASCRELVSRNRSAVEAVAAELRHRRKITGREVAALVRPLAA